MANFSQISASRASQAVIIVPIEHDVAPKARLLRRQPTQRRACGARGSVWQQNYVLLQLGGATSPLVGEVGSIARCDPGEGTVYLRDLDPSHQPLQQRGGEIFRTSQFFLFYAVFYN